MPKTIKSIAINKGMQLGFVLSSVTLLAYFIDLSILTKASVMLGLFCTTVFLAVLSIYVTKRFLDGFITLREAFSAFFITVLVGTVISTIISVVLFNFIDPEAAIIVKDNMTTFIADFMKWANAPADEIEKAVTQMKQAPSNYSIGASIQYIIKQLLFYSVIGIIASLIMKKTNQNF